MRSLLFGSLLLFVVFAVSLAQAPAVQNNIKPPSAVQVTATVVDPSDEVKVTVTLTDTSAGQSVTITSDDPVAQSAAPATLWFPSGTSEETFSFTVPEGTGESFEIRATAAGVTVASPKIYLR